MSKAWISGNCIKCSSIVIVTSSNTKDQDYFWQCSNPECTNNHQGSHTADDDHPDWVAMGETQRQVILSQLDCKDLLDILSGYTKQTGKFCSHLAKKIINSRLFYGPMKKED